MSAWVIRCGQALRDSAAKAAAVGPSVAVAFIVDTCAHRRGDPGGGVGRILMVVADVFHRVAIGHDIALEVPGAAQMLLSKSSLAQAGWPLMRL